MSIFLSIQTYLMNVELCKKLKIKAWLYSQIRFHLFGNIVPLIIAEMIYSNQSDRNRSIFKKRTKNNKKIRN